MSETGRISEEELHAYSDGELREDRRAAVRAYLAAHPADAQRLAAYRADGEAIGRIFARVGQPVRPEPVRRAAVRPATSSVWRMAAVFALVFAGAVAGTLLWRWYSDVRLWAGFGTEAATAHLAFEQRPSVPNGMASLQDIATVFSYKLHRRIELRDLSGKGYTLVHSRIVKTSRGRAAELAFKTPDGALISMYLEPWRKMKNTPFRPLREDGDVTTIGWIEDELGCAASADLPAPQLEKVARTLFHALVERA